MSKNKNTNPYLADYFAKKAKKENFAARSAFKLEEIQKKYSLFKKGQRVLDLGAAPGSWSQYAHRMIGGGEVIGIDLKDITITLPNVSFIKADMLATPLPELLENHGLSPGAFDVVMSDMAPNTTGIKFTDQMKSLELCEMALDIGLTHLKPGGHFICKLFHSDEFKTLKTKIQENFRQFHAVKPHSTRSISKEIFLVGLGRKSV